VIAPADVLVVDDDAGTCETIADVLRLKGHRVGTASLGHDGVAFLARTPVDVAIVDVKLPDISGLELLDAIKRVAPATEVIFVTAYASIATAVQAINGAAFAYLTKPFEMAHLLATIAKAREKQELIRRLQASEERYRLLVEHIHDAVFLIDLEGRFVFGNSRVAELTGYAPGELVGRSILTIMSPDGVRAAEARREAVLADPSQVLSYEMELVRKDGARRWVEIDSRSVFEGDRLVARIGAARDVTARRETERRRSAEYAVAAVLAQASGIATAAAPILRSVGEAFGWDTATLWIVDAEAGALRCVEVWERELRTSAAFADDTRAATFTRGIGLPGRVWETAAPLWIPDVADEPDVLRAETAHRAGLHAFFAFPIAFGSEVLGVIEFFSREIAEPDTGLLDWVGSIGRQIAQFIARTRAQDRLRETNLALESLLQSSPVAVIALDREGRVRWWNRSAERVFGWTEAEVLGRVLPMIPPGEQAEADATFAEWLRGNATTDVEVLRQRKDGSLVLVSRSGGALLDADGRVVGTISNLLDISQRKRAETALRESEERFRAVFEQAAVGIGVAALDGRWLRVNQRVCDMLGYGADELVGMRFQEITHPDDLPMNMAFRDDLVAGRRSSYELEKRYLHKSGAYVWVAVAVSVVADAAGGPAYAIVVIQDITARRQLEGELLHAQRMEGVGQLAGGIAHDFNNLLTVISGRSQLGIETLARSHPLHRDLDLIRKTADRAAALTRQLLAFSRKQILQPKVFALNELVAASTSLLQRLIGEDIELTFAAAPDAGRVRADPGQVEQVIVNLVVNARDAMPRGGRLTVETANADLDDAYAARHVGVTPGAHVMLAVSDTGIGMSPEVQARIFEPFFTTKGPGKGTGLGLATVYGIVKQTGGHVRVFSEPGAGTTFRIYLPRTDAAVEPAGRTEAAEAGRGTETVLLVEDESEVRVLAREVLERAGYTVLEARAPADAILIAERHVGIIDVLLTDVVMPGMSGRTLADVIAAERPETRVVFMSGYTDDAIVHHGVLDPGVNFVEKPFAPRELTAKIREALGDRPRRADQA